LLLRAELYQGSWFCPIILHPTHAEEPAPSLRRGPSDAQQTYIMSVLKPLLKLSILHWLYPIN